MSSSRPNPYVVEAGTRIVSRAEIYGDEDSEDRDDELERDLTVLGKRLRTLIENSVYVDGVQNGSGRRKKRKNHHNVESTLSEEQPQESIPFRLLSCTLPPHAISLESKPVPPTKSLEPECEDSDAEAELRAMKATAAAVEFSWLKSESARPYYPSTKEGRLLSVVHVSLSDPPPPMWIAEIPQPSRCTRAPHSSVDAAGPLDRRWPRNPRSMDCPIVAAKMDEAIGEFSMKSQRKSRSASVKKAKPHQQPIFWRPSSDMKGKARGYAFGYPGSYAPYQERNPRWYIRDTMKKAVVSH